MVSCIIDLTRDTTADLRPSSIIDLTLDSNAEVITASRDFRNEVDKTRERINNTYNIGALPRSESTEEMTECLPPYTESEYNAALLKAVKGLKKRDKDARKQLKKRAKDATKQLKKQMRELPQIVL